MNKDFELPAYGWRPRKDQVPLWSAIMNPNFKSGDIVAHRRYGKDELGLQAMAAKAMQRVGSFWYCLPQYEQARKAIWEMVNWRTKRTRIDDAFPPEIVTKKDNQGMMLWLESGSTVQLIGSDNIDSLVGGGQIGIVMSEAALSNPKAMLYFQPILEESGGWGLRISTPRGKNHFHKSYLASKEDMEAGVPGVFAAYMSAENTGVFPAAQLHKIKMDLIRKNGQKIGEAIFEQEYMCSFTAALIGAVWGSELSELEQDMRIGAFPHDRRLPVHTSWDLGVGDPTVILFWQEVGGRHRLIDAFESTDIGLDTYVQILRDKHFELGYHYGLHLGPHDIEQREFVRGLTRKDEAKRMGLIFKRMPQTRVATQINVGAQLIRMMDVNTKNPDVEAAFEHFKGYHYPINKQTGTIIPTPVHDEHSHASSALMTYAIHHAARLGVAVGDADPALHSGGAADMGLNQKFDPRDLSGSFAPYGHAGSVSSLMRGGYVGNPTRGAFG